MELFHHALVLGATRTGKTTTALRLLQKQEDLKIFVNTKNEKKWDKYCKYIRPSPAELQMILKNSEKFQDGIIAIYPDLLQDNSLLPFVDSIMNAHLENNLLNTNLCIDELHEFQSKNAIQKPLLRIWSMGLGLGLKAIGISQRPTQIHNDLFTNSEIKIIHSLNLNDLEHLMRWVNFVPLLESLHIKKLRNKDLPIIFPLDDEKLNISHKSYIQTNALEGLKKFH